MAAHLGLGGSSTWKSHLQRSRCSSGKPSLLPSRALQVQHCTAQPERRSANYMPNLWKHDYIESSSTTPSITENGSGGAHGLPRRVEELKEYVRLRLADEVAEPEALLELVSALGCLGVDYHFREEINGLLSSLWSARITCVFSKGSLHSTALLFRLLREHYYEFSQGIKSHLSVTQKSFRLFAHLGFSLPVTDLCRCSATWSRLCFLFGSQLRVEFSCLC